MNRSKKVVFVSHCLLNTNSKVKGLSTTYAGAFRPLIESFMTKDYGIVQLPCPELQYMGLKRWSMTKEQYDFPAFRSFCMKLAENSVAQMKMYQDEGYELCGIYGIDGSPTCGVAFSCKGFGGGCFEHYDSIEEYPLDEKGIFMESLEALIKEYDIRIQFYGINEANPTYTE